MYHKRNIYELVNTCQEIKPVEPVMSEYSASHTAVQHHIIQIEVALCPVLAENEVGGVEKALHDGKDI